MYEYQGIEDTGWVDVDELGLVDPVDLGCFQGGKYVRMFGKEDGKYMWYPIFEDNWVDLKEAQNDVRANQHVRRSGKEDGEYKYQVSFLTGWYGLQELKNGVLANEDIGLVIDVGKKDAKYPYHPCRVLVQKDWDDLQEANRVRENKYSGFAVPISKTKYSTLRWIALILGLAAYLFISLTILWLFIQHQKDTSESALPDL
jgi:hypothetical protein